MDRRWTGLARFADAAALSAAVGLLYLPIGVVAIWSDRSRMGGDLVAWVAAAVASQAVLSGVLAVGGWLGRRRAARASPWPTLSAYVLAGIARGVTIAIVLDRTGIATGEQADWLYRIVGGGLFSASILVAAGWVVVAYADHRRLVDTLAARRDDLLRVRADLDRDVGIADRALADEVRGRLEPQVITLEERLAAVAHGGSGSDAADAFRAFIEQEVRPLGHRLAVPLPVPREATPTAGTAARGRIPFPGRIGLVAGIEPWFVVVIFGGAVLPAAIRATGPGPGLLFTATVAIGAAVYLHALRWLLRGVVLPTALAVIASALLHGLFAIVVSLLLVPLGLPRPVGLLPPGIAVATLIGAAVMVAGVAGARRAATAADLAATVSALEASLAELRIRTALTRMRLAYVVHGDIQGALHAAVFLLTRPEPPAPHALDGLRLRIRAALAALGAPLEPGVSLDGSIAELAALWEGTCDIRIDRAEGIAPVGDLPEPTRTAAATVVREAVGNAIRHGGARHIDIGWVAGAGRVELRVDDDGRGWSGERADGLGVSLYDELCPGWRVEANGRGTRLIAPVPLPAGPAGH